MVKPEHNTVCRYDLRLFFVRKRSQSRNRWSGFRRNAFYYGRGGGKGKDDLENDGVDVLFVAILIPDYREVIVCPS